MTDTVRKLWPELEWIKDAELREKTARTWELALSRSVLTPEDLEKIPFTLLCGPDLKVSFMAHKRCVVHVAKESGEKMNQFFGTDLPVDMDVLISGAILADVGKLLEYEIDSDGKASSGQVWTVPPASFFRSSSCRGVRCTPEVCHIIAAHAHEGDLVKRTTEAWIVHHADFMTFMPFKNRLVV